MPKIVIHNSISLDGSLTNFEPNMGLHYQLAGNYRPDAHLIGSNTIEAGVELYGNGVPPEEKADFKKPKKNKDLPYWVVVDTRGKLKGLLHTGRRFEFCRDIIVLVSEKTPGIYLQYLTARNYDYHVVGKDHIDLKKAILLLSDKYKVETLLTDTGRILSNLLINKRLADEISLLVHPIIVGNNSYNMFSDIAKSRSLKLVECEILEKQYTWLIYKPYRKR